MRSAKTTGRIVGGLLFVQLAGLIVPFVMLLPLTTGPQAYLANAAGAAEQIRMAVLLLLANSALTVGISIVAFGVFREYSEALALGLLAAGVAMFLMQAVDNVHVLSMLSLSRQYAEAGGQGEWFQALAASVGATRRWTHLTELVIIDCWMFLLYGILHRSRLVPRALAGFGLMTVALHFTGIPVRIFMGQSPVSLLGMPMGLAGIALGTWLVVKGFEGGSG